MTKKKAKSTNSKSKKDIAKDLMSEVEPSFEEANPNLIDATEAFIEKNNNSEFHLDESTSEKKTSGIQAALHSFNTKKEEEKIVEDSISNEQEPEDFQLSSDHTLGSYLREMREKKGIDLKNIAITTRISFKILSAIENDDQKQFPNRTYLRGFVRSFARFVDANEDFAVELMERGFEAPIKTSIIQQDVDNTHDDYNGVELDETQSVYSKKIEDNFQNLKDLKINHSPVSTKLILSLGLAGIFLFGIGYGIYSLFTTTEKEVNERIVEKKKSDTVNEIALPAESVSNEEDQKTQTENEVAKTDIETNSSDKVQEEVIEAKTVENKVETEEKVVSTEPPVKVTEEKQVEEDKETIQTADNDAVVETNTKEKEEDLDNAIDDELRSFWEKEVSTIPLPTPLFQISSNNPLLNNPNVFPENIKTAYNSDSSKQHVFVNATRNDTWLSYKSDNRPIKSFILKKGRTLLIRGDEIRLFLGRFQAVDVFYNNQHLTANADGVKSLVFPVESAEKYKIPLFIYNPVLNKYYTLEEFEKGKKEFLSSQNN